jgi:hypothetical protein
MQMELVEQQVRQWLEQVVIGLNLCPFAGLPYRNGQVRISVSQATTEDALLADLERELAQIDQTPASKLETTLLVVAGMLADFDAYNEFLTPVDALLRQEDCEGKYQVATFHPHYRFRGTRDDDPGNFTNRSPWPILHIIREASITQALSDYPDAEAIPERNISKMQSLTLPEIRNCFPWLPPHGLSSTVGDVNSK